MADSITVKMTGIDDLRRALADLPTTLRRKVLVGALRKAARVVATAAKQAVPVLSVAAPYRTPGLLKKRIAVRVSKAARQAGNVGVFVNIKPAAGAKFSKGVQVKASQRGAKSQNDPYYWRFVEFGTKKMAARPFLRPAADALPNALAVFEQEVVPQIEKLNKAR